MPADPISPYGVAKLAAERYCVAFSRVYESFETVVLRYFNVFGPRQSPSSQYAAVIPLFLTAIAAGEPITIHGDGEQSRDFTYVDNVVAATMRRGRRAGGERPYLQRRGRLAGDRESRSPTRSARSSARSRSSSSSRAAAGRHPRLVGRPRRGARRARLRDRRSRSRKACADGRGADWLKPPLRRRANPRAAPDRPAEHGRAGAARRLPDARPRHSAATRRRSSQGRSPRGENSMSFVAEELGVDVTPIRQLHRELSPLYDSLAVWRLVQLIRELPAAHPAHAHREGGRGRPHRGAARRASAAADHRAHLPRPRPARLLRPAPDGDLPRRSSAGSRAITTRLVAVSPQVRDELVGLGVAPAEQFSVIRLGIDLDRRLAEEGDRRSRPAPALRRLAATRSSSAGSGG